MKLSEYIDEMNVNGQLEYVDYNNLRDMANELEAENAELSKEIKKLELAIDELWRENDDLEYKNEYLNSELTRKARELEKAVNSIKIGNPIYFVENGHIYGAEISDIYSIDNETFVKWAQCSLVCNDNIEYLRFDEVLLSDYNKTWFTDPEKAKAELKGGEQ